MFGRSFLKETLSLAIKSAVSDCVETSRREEARSVIIHKEVPVAAVAPVSPVPSPQQSAINQPLEPFDAMPKNHAEALTWIATARSQEQSSRATFVQIGANNGEMFDPLYPHTRKNKTAWIGLQVEPQPELYSNLAVLHADAPDWAFYHGALAHSDVCTNGTLAFCETKTPGVGDWKTQGQLNRVGTAFCNNANMHVRWRPCITSFEELITQHASPVFLQYAADKTIQSPTTATTQFNIDFLQIDVEGNDYGVLQLIDWTILRPHCIQYEHLHLRDKKPLAATLMRDNGYTLHQGAMDVLACRVRPNRQ